MIQKGRVVRLFFINHVVLGVIRFCRWARHRSLLFVVLGEGRAGRSFSLVTDPSLVSAVLAPSSLLRNSSFLKVPEARAAIALGPVTMSTFLQLMFACCRVFKTWTAIVSTVSSQ
jgi:hypothetical protein